MRSAKGEVPLTWAILSGEYPPSRGGVGDYTRKLAFALAEAGDRVHVFAPGLPSGTESGGGVGEVRLHALSDRFGMATRRQVAHRIARLGGAPRILVQYVPHAFGSRGMNVPFCAWLLGKRGRWQIGVMFHEVAYPIDRGQIFRHNVLGVVTHFMAAVLARAATRLFVSTSSWDRQLRPGLSRGRATWCIPIPTNLPMEACGADVARARERLAPGGEHLIGHFGTYGPATMPLLRNILPKLWRPGRRVALLGFGAEAAGAAILKRHPGVRDGLIAVGELTPEAAASHIVACDVMVQPYPDGITTRRSSAMAALALGRAIVTGIGPLSESLWSEPEVASAIGLAQSNDPDAIADLVDRFTANQSYRRETELRALDLYRSRFALRHSVTRLRGAWR